MGLAGIQGPLPTPYTEVLLDRIRQRDHSFQDFLDIFNHRLTSLWYRLQKKMVPIISGKLPHQTLFGQSIFDLAGFPDPSLFEATAIPQGAMVNCSALFWQRPRSNEGLITILRNYLGVSANVIPFQGKWRQASKRDLTHLGAQPFDFAPGNFVPGQNTAFQGRYNRLGLDARVGSKSWDQQAGIHIEIGLLKWKEFLSLLPSEPQNNFKILQELSSLYVGLETEITFFFHVNAKEIQPTPLGKRMSLGWNSWCLGSRKNAPSPTHSKVAIRGVKPAKTTQLSSAL